MNASALYTVTWGQWQKIRWMLVTALIGIAAAYALLIFADSRGIRPGAGEPSEDFLVALLLIGLPSLVTAGSVLLIHSDAERLYISLPPRVLRLPVATPKLVAIFMGFGVVVASLVALAATVPAFFILNVDFPWWLPIFTAAFAMPLIQLWAYAFGGLQPRLAAVSFVICFGTLAWLAQRPALVSLATKTHPLVALLVLAAQLAVVYGVSVWIATCCRKGLWLKRFSALAAREGAERKRRPFSSKWTAQFWYEWRQFGGLLPLYSTGVAVAYFLGLPLIVGVFRLSDTTGLSSGEPLFSISWYTSAQFVTTGLGLATLVGSVIVGGIMFMRAGHWNAQSKYLLTRPLSIHRIASARVYVMAASAAVTLTILAAIMGAVSALVAAQGQKLGLVDFLGQGYDKFPDIVPVLLYWGGLLVILWLGSWSVAFAWVLVIVVLTHVPTYAAIWGLALLGVFSFADAHLLSMTALSLCNWVASAILVLGLLGMAYRTGSQRLIHPGFAWAAATILVAYSIAFYVYVDAWAVPPDAKDWVYRFPQPVDWSMWVGLAALPITPLFLHPLLLARARNR